MPTLTTPLDVYKLLPRTNCGACGISSCIAFAAAVIKEEKKLSDCMHLGQDVISAYSGSVRRQVNLEGIRQEQLVDLQTRLSRVDLAGRASLLGGRFDGEQLTITCLGKDFRVDAGGRVSSLCHTHAWFSLPFLDYVVSSSGTAPQGQWMPFRELAGGQKWSGLFEQRCEKPLRALADGHPDLFQDLVSMFCATSAAPGNADVSVVLSPFPRVPMLVSYWRAEERMESKLHVFFDKSAEQNLPLDSLFTLGTGIAMMLDRIMAKHDGT